MGCSRSVSSRRQRNTGLANIAGPREEQQVGITRETMHEVKANGGFLMMSLRCEGSTPAEDLVGSPERSSRASLQMLLLLDRQRAIDEDTDDG